MVISHTASFSMTRPCFLDIVSTSRSVQPYPQQGQRASRCPEFLPRPRSSVLRSPCCLLWPQQQPGPQGHMLAGERECVNARLTCVLGGRERERKRTSLFPWDYIGLGLGQTRCSFKKPINFPRFGELLIGLYLLVRRTGLCGQAPVPVSPQQSGMGGGRKEC